MPSLPIDADGFEALYAGDPDPFGVAGRWYERRKQAVLTASLAREHYDLVWDCATGTGRLALALLRDGRCARVLATDAAPTAVRLTRELLDGRDGATCAVSALPDVPGAALPADLVVVAEVLYYLPDEPRAAALAALAALSGELVTVHWRHHPHDAHLSGADVTLELDEALTSRGWTSTVRHDDVDFVLAGWVPGGQS